MIHPFRVRRQLRRAILAALFGMLSTAPMSTAQVAPAPSPQVLITAEVIQKARDALASSIVQRSIKAQNAKYGDLSETEIDKLDKQWRAERESDDKPLISMTLSNPLSSYLTREQANEIGLYAAIFVMDRNGLNVGQSAITGDFWQGDEAKFQKTFPVSGDAVFIDEPEWVDDFKIWIAQLNLTIADADTGKPVGSATFDINLTELDRRAAIKLAN
ncbi:MAG: hypothetical protein KTR21_01550 [Rhodobacteraceae bacterium]|nr:hypothetical protein [Paracoccaceae bacterium]